MSLPYDETFTARAFFVSIAKKRREEPEEQSLKPQRRRHGWDFLALPLILQGLLSPLISSLLLCSVYQDRSSFGGRVAS